jgi:hypothetical protein
MISQTMQAAARAKVLCGLLQATAMMQAAMTRKQATSE